MSRDRGKVAWRTGARGNGIERFDLSLHLSDLLWFETSAEDALRQTIFELLSLLQRLLSTHLWGRGGGWRDGAIACARGPLRVVVTGSFLSAGVARHRSGRRHVRRRDIQFISTSPEIFFSGLVVPGRNCLQTGNR